MALVDTLVVKLLVQGREQLTDAEAAAALLDATTKKLTTSTQKATGASNENAATNERVTRAIRTTTNEFAKFVGAQDKASGAALKLANGLDRVARFTRELQLDETQSAAVKQLVIDKYNLEIAAANKAADATKAYGESVQQSSEHIAAYVAEIARIKPIYDTVYAAGLKFGQAQKEINLLLRAGELTADQAAVALAAATKAYDDVATAAGNASRALKGAVPPSYAEFLTEVAAYETKVEGLAQTYDKVYAAGLRYKQVQQEVNLLVGAGRISEAQAAAALAEAADAYDKVATAAGNAARAAKDAVPPSYAEFVDQLKAYEKEVDGLRLKYVPLVAIEKQHEAELAAIAKAAALGNTVFKTQEEHEAALLTETQRYDSALRSVSSNLDHTSNLQGKATQTTGQLNAAVTNLGFQINDIASGLLSGQSPFTILVQQGGQVIQAFTQGGGVSKVLGGLVDTIKGMITPTTAIVGGLVAFGGALAFLALRSEATQQRLKEYNTIMGALGNGAQTSALALESISKSLQHTGTAATDANAAMLALSRNPMLNPGAGITLTPLARDIGAVTGENFVQVQDKMATAFTTSTDAAIKFVQSVAGPNGLTAAEQENMKIMAAHGDRAGALQVAIDALQKKFGGSFKEQMTESSKAINSIGSAWGDMLDKLANTTAVTIARDAVIGMLKGIAAAASGSANQAAASTQDAEAGASTAIGGVFGVQPNNMAVGGAIGGAAAASANLSQLNTVFAQRINAWLESLSAADRASVVITQTGRTYAQQVANFANSDHTGRTVAVPGGSLHGMGVAIDAHGLSASARNSLALFGLHEPVVGDPGHIEPIETLSSGTALASARRQSALDFLNGPGSVGGTGVAGTQFGTGVFATAVSPTLPAVSPLQPLPGGLTEKDRQDMQDTLEFDAKLKAAAGMSGTSQTWWTAYLSNLGKGTKEEKDIWVAMEAANQAVAVQATENTKAAQTQKITNDLGLQTADAYGTDVVSGYQAAAKAEAELAVRNGTANDVASKTAEILRTQAVTAIASGAEQLAASKKEEEAQQRLAAAASESSGALHDMQVVNEGVAKTQDAYNKALATGDQALISRAKALQDASIEEAKRLDVLKTTTEIQTKILGNKDNIEVLKLEGSLASESADEIQRQVTLLQTKQYLDSKGLSVTKEQRDALMKNTDELTKQTAATADQQRAAQRLNDVLTSVGQTIDQAITQNVENALSGKKITSWHEIFKNALVQLESQLISMSVIKPAIGSLLSMFGFGGAATNFGTLTGAGGILSGGGAGSLLGGVFGGTQQQQQPITLEQRDPSGNLTGTLSTVANAGSLANTGSGLFGGGGSGGLFGSGGISGFVNNTIGTSLGFAPSGLLPGSGAGAGIFTNAATGATSDIAGSGVAGGLFGGTTLGGFLGGVGAGATVGSLANMFIGPMIGGGKSTGGMIGSTGGALAGAIIGSIVPGIGTLLGGIIGGAGGGLLGGFFGAGKANNAGSGSLNLATGQLGAFTSGGVAANDQQAQGILQPISTALSNITGILGQSVLPQATLIAQAGSRDGIKVNIASGEGVKTFTGSDAGAVVQEVATFLFEHRDLSQLSPTLGKAVGSLDINQIQDPAQLQTAVQFSKIYDDLKTAADSAFTSVETGAQQAGPFEQAMTQISDTFGQLTTQAQQYGLSIDPINAALAEATKRLNVDFAKAVDAAFNTATGNDFLNGVQAVVDNYQSMAREASAIGAAGTVFDKLGQTYDASLKSLFSQLNSTQLNAVIAAFGDLNNDLPALAASARDAALASEALIASQNQQAQTYQNQNDFYNASNQGFLAQLRDLDKARIATQATNQSLGLGSDQDAQVQESEHRAALNILQALTNDQLEAARKVLADLNPAFAQWVDEAKAATIATQQQADAQARSNAILAAGLQIRQYLNAQETGPDYTSPQSRLEAARSQFQTQLGLAQGGDVNALQGITGIADQLKAALQGWFASSAPGAAEWEAAKAALAALPGVPNAQDTATNAIVDAINDNGTATVSTISDVTNATAQQIIGTTIATNQAIVDNARTTSRDIVSATGDSSTRIVTTAIDTSNSIVANGIAGAASIVGATTTGLDLATGATLTSAAQITAASNNTATAVNIAADVTKSGTMALLDSNAANAATLIAGSKEDTLNLLAQQEANSGALLTANAVQSAALVDQNSRDAAAVVATTNTTAASIVAQNDNASKQIIDTATATGNASVATANANTTDMIWTANATSSELATRTEAASAGVAATTQAGTNALLAKNDQQIAAIQALSGVSVGEVQIVTAIYQAGDGVIQNTAAWSNAIYQQIAAYGTWNTQTVDAWGNAIAGTIGAWGNATCQNIAAWGNAEVGNANNNANNTINMLAAVANAISNSIFSSGSTQIAATYGSSSNEIGATFANGNSIIGAIGSMSVANIAAIYGSANSIVGQTGVIPAYVDQARNDNNWWLGTINGTLNGINSNEVAWNQNLYNKLQEILNNIVGWNQNLWNELHIIHEYMQLLTEVTINFDEFMAGSQGANTDIMNQIQDTLRRQAFG